MDRRSYAKHARLESESIRNFCDTCCPCLHNITGFGLLGHLLEMLADNDMGATLFLEQIPTFAGTLTTLGRGIVSSLHTDNQLNAARISNQTKFQNHELFPVLFDPQTAGGR